MDWVAVQAYQKVQREVNGLEQKAIVDERTMYLYTDRVVTRYREFSLQQVFDMSYRKLGEGGLLYLHTGTGVYSYQVRDDPQAFIQAFQRVSRSGD